MHQQALCDRVREYHGYGIAKSLILHTIFSAMRTRAFLRLLHSRSILN